MAFQKEEGKFCLVFSKKAGDFRMSDQNQSDIE
jgi:hypothetical protein